MADNLKDFYQSVKIDKTPDPTTEERKHAILEAQLQKLEVQINYAMEIITKNQPHGYCIIDYCDEPSTIAMKLRDVGFTVREEKFSPLVGHRYCLDRYSLIVSWQVFNDDTYEKIIHDLSAAKRKQYSDFMRRD